MGKYETDVSGLEQTTNKYLAHIANELAEANRLKSIEISMMPIHGADESNNKEYCSKLKKMLEDKA